MIRVKKVKMGKKWEITTPEEYERAMEELEDARFCAKMSDDFWREMRELEEIARQETEVTRQAREKGIA